MICEPCRTSGHQSVDCEDAHRDKAVYRSCCCQHRKSAAGIVIVNDPPTQNEVRR